MKKTLLLCAAGVLVCTSAWAEGFHGRMTLRDASNNDRRVGPSPRNAIPQGHTLKVVIRKAKFGRRLAAGAEVLVLIRKGDDMLANEQGTLDRNGCAEIEIPVDVDWLGVYHAAAIVGDLDDEEDDEGGGNRRRGGMQVPFRVCEADPNDDLPDGLPALFLMLGSVMLVVWWVRPRPTKS